VNAAEVLVEINDPDARAAWSPLRAAFAFASGRGVGPARLEALRAGATIYTRQQAEEGYVKPMPRWPGKSNLAAKNNSSKTGTSRSHPSIKRAATRSSQNRSARSPAHLADVQTGASPDRSQIRGLVPAVRGPGRPGHARTSARRMEPLGRDRISAPISGVVVETVGGCGQTGIEGACGRDLG